MTHNCNELNLYLFDFSYIFCYICNERVELKAARASSAHEKCLVVQQNNNTNHM